MKEKTTILINLAPYRLDLRGCSVTLMKNMEECLSKQYGALMRRHFLHNLERRDRLERSKHKAAFKSIFKRLILITPSGEKHLADAKNYFPCPKEIPGNGQLILPHSFSYSGSMGGRNVIFNMKLQLLIYKQRKMEFFLSEKDVDWLTSHHLETHKTPGTAEIIRRRFQENLSKGYFIRIVGNLYKLSKENEHLYRYILPKETPSKRLGSVEDSSYKTPRLPFMKRVKVMIWGRV